MEGQTFSQPGIPGALTKIRGVEFNSLTDISTASELSFRTSPKRLMCIKYSVLPNVARSFFDPIRKLALHYFRSEAEFTDSALSLTQSNGLVVTVSTSR